MPVEPIQCPKCGGVLQVQRTDGAATCPYCGMRFRVTVGTSGHLMGILGEIKSDTGIMAKREAIEYLEGRVANLKRERMDLDERIRAEAERDVPPMPPWTGAPSGSCFGFLLRCAAIVAAFMAFSLVVTWVAGARPEFGTAAKLVLVSLVLWVLSDIILSWSAWQPSAEPADATKERERLRSEGLGRATAMYGEEAAELDAEIEATSARIDQLYDEIDRLAMVDL